MQVQTGTDGKVISAVAVSGPGIFRQAAAHNAKTWRFAPGRSEVTVVYEFKIEGKAEARTTRTTNMARLFSSGQTPSRWIFPALILVRGLAARFAAFATMR